MSVAWWNMHFFYEKLRSTCTLDLLCMWPVCACSKSELGGGNVWMPQKYTSSQHQFYKNAPTDTICQLNQFHTNSEAAMLSTILAIAWCFDLTLNDLPWSLGHPAYFQPTHCISLKVLAGKFWMGPSREIGQSRRRRSCISIQKLQWWNCLLTAELG